MEKVMRKFLVVNANWLHVGTLEFHEGTLVHLREARRVADAQAFLGPSRRGIWTPNELALYGDDVPLSAPVPEIWLTAVSEIIPLSAEAEAFLLGS